MERVERCGSVSHCLLRYLQQGGVAFLTYPAHLHVADGAIYGPLRIFLTWHVKLCMPTHVTIRGLSLSHPFLPVLLHRIMWHERAAARRSLLFVKAPCMCRVLLGGLCSMVQCLTLTGNPIPDITALWAMQLHPAAWFWSAALYCQPRSCQR